VVRLRIHLPSLGQTFAPSSVAAWRLRLPRPGSGPGRKAAAVQAAHASWAITPAAASTPCYRALELEAPLPSELNRDGPQAAKRTPSQ